MADISILSRLISGVQRNVDISQNSLVVGSLKVGTSSPTELTKAILDNLVSLQNGSDVAASLHHHDGRYFTETELSSTGATSGADRIGVNNTPANYTAASQTVQDHLEGIDAALTAAGNERADNLFRIVDNLDNSKKIAFEAANIATATVRTITMPNANVNLADVNQSILQDGTRAMSANLSLGSNKITNLANGTNPNDAVNLSQLDSALSGLDFQKDINASVANATTTAPGVGLPAAATGQRYILESGTGSLNAAWGTITGVGNNDIVEYNGTAWVVAYDVSVLGEGALVWNREQNYFMRWDGSTWNEFGGLAGIVAGAGLIKSSNVLAIELDTNAGLEFDVPGDGGKLRVLADDSTIERSASGIRVKALGITDSQLANGAVLTAKIGDNQVTEAKLASSVAGNGLAGGAGTPLSVGASPTNEYVVQPNHLDILAAQRVRLTMVAGESFAANTSFLVRLAVNGETGTRVYKADNNAATLNNFYVIGIAKSSVAVSAGDNIEVTAMGLYIRGSSDASFLAADIGKPIYLGANGAYTVTPPSTADLAVVKIGIVYGTNEMFVQPQVIGIL